MNRLVTYGYGANEQRQTGLLSDLEYLAKEQGVIIVDCRLIPKSANRFFDHTMLDEKLGPFYEHSIDLSNMAGNNPGDLVSIVDIEAGLDYLERQLAYRPVCLLCKCADWQKCHRRYIIEELEFRNPGLEVVHLGRGERVSL